MRFKELPKQWQQRFRCLAISSSLFIILLAGFQAFLVSFRATNQANRAILVKADDQLIGERLTIERDGKTPVQAILYRPTGQESKDLPVVFNIHGGGFLGGDADVLDTQSQRLADQGQVLVVAINYTKADVRPIAYGAEEIKDTALYFAKEAKAYGVNPDKLTILGYSAGAYYGAEAARLLTADGFALSSLVLAYPWMTGLPIDDFKQDFPPTLAILAGQDPISQKAQPILKTMQEQGLSVDVLTYENAVHSFIESNNPEGNTDQATDFSEVITPEREVLARQAEQDILTWIKNLYSHLSIHLTG